MLTNIRNRLIVIGLLVVAALYGLWPRTVIRQLPSADGGAPRDTVVKEWNLKYGLDLQGGMHLALEVDQSGGPVANPEDALDRAETVIRSRIDEFGVAEPLIQKVGTDRLIVELPGIDNPQRAKDVVERSAFLEFRITDMDGRFDDARPTIDAALARAGIRRRGRAAANAGAAPIEQLLTADSSRGQDSTAAAADTTQADSTGALNPTEPGVLSSMLFQGDIPGEFLVPEEDYPFVDSLVKMPEFQRAIPRGLDILWSNDVTSQGGRPFRAMYAVQSRPIITGEYLSDAQAQLDPTFNQAVVNFQLTRSGGRIFSRETAQHVGDYMAIVLDGHVQGRPPVIRSQIGRRGQIELGSASIQDAQDLALVLRAGALPAPLTIVEERTVGPSLGSDSVQEGKRAGIVATVLVVLIMLVYYRLAGVFAVGALGFYVLFTLGGLGMLEATLTLPGLAGFVLSLGLAVDANVLIFERIREELALNKSPRIAVELGFRHAMPAIIDANVTTVIMAAFLFQFGTGPVKGFAVTLIIGIVASVVTAVFVTQTFFMIWLQRRSAAAEFSI
jgi:preprotein translocase subunit SecD